MPLVSSRAVLFAAPYQIIVKDQSIDCLHKNEVLVESICSGISSGTEMLAYRGQLPEGISLDATIEELQNTDTYPFCYGYCNVGRIIATGDSANDYWQDKRVFSFHPHESHFAKQLDSLIALPSELDSECAIFLPNMETALGLIMDGAPMIGENVLVMGLGVVGQLLTLLLQRHPLNKLTVVDPQNKRRALVSKNEFTEVLPEIRYPQRNAGNYDLVYETSGHPEALNTALNHTGYKGRIVIGSWYGNKIVSVDLGSHFHRSKITIYPSQVSVIDPKFIGRWDKKRRINLALKYLHELRPNYLISHQYQLQHAPLAYDRIDTKKDTVQVILTYH